MSCFDEVFTKPLCCDCNFAGCWKASFSPEHCCAGDSVAVSLLQNRSSFSMMSQRLCEPLEVVRCADEAFQTDQCQLMVKYVQHLPSKCSDLPGDCIPGWAAIAWHLTLQKFYRRKRGRSSHGCFKFLSDLRLLYAQMKATLQRLPNNLEASYIKLQGACAEIRQRELKEMVARARLAFQSKEERFWVQQRPRVGVVLAMSEKDMSSLYRNTLHLWKCYCAKHGDCEVVVELKNFLKITDYPVIRTHDTYRRGFAWNRWFALQRHLDAYEWVFTADPDQFISRQCFSSYSFSDVLREAKVDEDPSVVMVMRDFPEFHTLNSAGIFFKASEAARLFLSLLTSRLHQQGLLDFDQSAFDQSLLEFLDLWLNVKEKHSHFSSTSCQMYQVPAVDNRPVMPEYYECWHQFLTRAIGEFGHRRHEGPVRFLNPSRVDINYVIGGRDTKDEPLLWHYAGHMKSFLFSDSGVSHMDMMLKQLWQIKDDEPFPENCSSWEATAGHDSCAPGTEVIDCRIQMPWLAIC